MSSVGEIHSVGTITNVETSYFTQLKMCHLMTNFSMSVGHLDHVSTVYSSMEHVTWKSRTSLSGASYTNRCSVPLWGAQFPHF